MVPWLKKLLYDETVGVRALRAILVGCGIFATQADIPPTWKAIGAALAGMGAFIGAGEKNQPGTPK